MPTTPGNGGRFLCVPDAIHALFEPEPSNDFTYPKPVKYLRLEDFGTSPNAPHGPGYFSSLAGWFPRRRLASAPRCGRNLYDFAIPAGIVTKP